MKANILVGVMDLEAQRHLRDNDRPTAVFCTNYISSLRLLKAVQEMSMRIPNDISLIGFGDYDFTPIP